MKLAFISDTHGHLPDNFLTEEVDILFHCGDICPRVNHNVAFQACWISDNFYPWFASHPAKHKVMIAGNHDFVFMERVYRSMTTPPPGIHYLEHESITIEGIKIFGSPWQPWYYDWAFNAPRGEPGRKFLRNKWNDIPSDTNILLTHGPAYGILDKVKEGSGREGRSGCLDLLDLFISHRLKNLNIHAFGHIHENKPILEDERTGTVHINAAMTDNRYKMINTPIIVEYPYEIHN